MEQLPVLFADIVETGLTVLIFSFLLLIAAAIVLFIASGNLIQGIAEKNRNKIQDALPYFIFSGIVFLAVIFFWIVT